MPHPASLPEDELLKDCEITFHRRSGPGGQHRNKVETAVRLRHLSSGVEAEANERRSQAANRAVAVKRLRLKLAVAVRCEIVEEDFPGPLWKSRCNKGRIAVSDDHTDFPAILAEALDALAHCDYGFAAAGELLTITGSQLVKLLKKEPAAFTAVNCERKQHDLPPLR